MDVTSIYSTRIIKSFDEDQSEILAVFAHALKNKTLPPIKLINYFKGLPLIYTATIAGVERNTLDLDVQPQQAVAMAATRYTLIRCKQFPHDIAAQVQYSNAARHSASLCKLCFVEIMAERRNSIRLELAQYTPASFHFEGQEISGKLFDISTGGAAVKVDDCYDIPTGSEVTLNLLFPDLLHGSIFPCKVKARLVNILGHASPYTCCFTIQLEKIQEQQLSRYIFQRQIEIIRDLKDATG